MYSRAHFLISAFVAVAVLVATGSSVADGALLVAYGAILGTLIDLDHFVLARLTTGHWRALRYCVTTPSAVFRDQSSIFAAGEVGRLRRLLSHALLGGVLVGGLFPLDPFLAGFTALVVYAHVVADLVDDVRSVEGWKRSTA